MVFNGGLRILYLRERVHLFYLYNQKNSTKSMTSSSFRGTKRAKDKKIKILCIKTKILKFKGADGKKTKKFHIKTKMLNF